MDHHLLEAASIFSSDFICEAKPIFSASYWDSWNQEQATRYS